MDLEPKETRSDAQDPAEAAGGLVEAVVPAAAGVVTGHPALVLLRWAALGAGVGALAGAASAVFLIGLDLATDFRTSNQSLVFLLPLAGLLIGAAYQRLGAPIRGGNDLVIDTIHDEGPKIPLRMFPMVLVGTVLTHLFGGSAGREGTAVQMGASLADDFAHRLGLSPATRLQLLTAGVAGGFGSVFGTPVAGTVFALEFVVWGQLQYRALVPALTAAVIGDYVTVTVFGVSHTPYPRVEPLPLDPLLLGKWVAFAAAVALVSSAFIELTHRLKAFGARRLPGLALRMFAGGILVVGLWQLVGSDDYLGLGVPTIVRAFEDPTLPAWAFALKLLFTSVTLAAGFLGGEVTPLFFIGAALGNALAEPLGLPLALAAGVGLAATFGSAANAPLALSIMAAELLGAAVLPHALVVSVLACVLSGRRSIYRAQRLHAKPGRLGPLGPPTSRSPSLRSEASGEPPSPG